MSVSIPIVELVKLAAVDNDLYARTFFPKTFRQKSPTFAKEIDDVLDNSKIRFANILAYRGAAKTTRSRVFTSKRIAYGVSRTILYIGSSEDAALRSIRWLKNQVTRNHFWSGTFGLSAGEKWAENEIEIKHKLFDHPIWVLGVGITSTNIRGINFDDYRPDLIVGDDILQDENSATLEQREKVSSLILSAVKNSLISRIEEPNAKMVLLNTPQHREDFSQQAKSDPEFTTLEIPCWTKQTVGLPVTQQVSAWPELYPTADLRAEKLSALARNRLSIFTREKEVKLSTPETSAFRPGWLKVTNTKPAHPFCVLGVDPLPPPSDRQRATGLATQDWEAQYVWGRENGEYYLMEGLRSQGHDPNWTINTFFYLAHKYRIARAVVESVAYQRTLKWMLEQEMKRRRIYYVIIPFLDKRKKSTRIISTFSGIAAAGLVNIGPEDTVFAEQFYNYSDTVEDHDDDLDASSIALSDLVSPALEIGGSLRDEDVENLVFRRNCP